MQQKQILPVGKKDALGFSSRVLEEKMKCGVKRIKYIGGGSFGFVYRAEIDREPFSVIMKACRTKGICAREAEELALLGSDSIIKVPEVYFTYTASEEIPVDFICMERVSGTDCFTDFSKLLSSRKTKERFADEVTTAARYWHEKTNVKFGLIGNAVYDEWLDYYTPFARSVLKSAEQLTNDGKLDNKTFDTMKRAWSAFDYIFSEKVTAAGLIHGDLNVMNIMSDRSLRKLAVIDPLESKWADIEYELFQMRNLTGDRFGLYETYKKKYRVSEKCDIKTAFYALYHEVYAYINSGRRINSILIPLVKRMNTELDICNH